MTNTQDSWPAGLTATMNVTYTQANAAGGAVVCEISPGSGNEFILLGFTAVNSGTNGIISAIETAVGGGNVIVLGVVASAAGANMRLGLGTTGSGAATTGGTAGLAYPQFVSGTQALQIKQSAAGAQNDTFSIGINIRSRGAMPTVTHANSTNVANVTVTAGSETFTTV